MEKYALQCIFWLLAIIGVYTYIEKLNKKTPQKENKKTPIEKSYNQKEFMTKSENEFYEKMLELKSEYEIVPQVNLATIIDKQTAEKYRNELFRNIDFGIFTKDYKKIILLIELNDNTHNNKSRKDRDLKVKKICNEARIKIITFYTCYPNEKEYVLNRIKKEIDEIISDKKENIAESEIPIIELQNNRE